jgi:2-polyprenyl-3-methyl-5-hydroxy-6-metoxy-1,4-benzoquinol methylase
MDNTEKVTFSFGKNWQEFVASSFSEARVTEAMKSLTDFFGFERLDGMSFIDVGCGSGLFSLAAYRLGVSHLTSFDLDQLSVECCKFLKNKEGNPENWVIRSGSILEPEFLLSLGKADIVYSWGVLHHTGNMKQAIENTIQLVNPRGFLYLALYNKVAGIFGSTSWLLLKMLYNRSPALSKRLLEMGFSALVFLKMLITFRNPFYEVRHYDSKRGMSFFTDVRDSLGGYPYESAFADDITVFCSSRGMKLQNIKTVTDLSLNEFLFLKI